MTKLDYATSSTVSLRGYTLKVWTVSSVPNLIIADAVKKDLEACLPSDPLWIVVDQLVKIATAFRSNYWLMSSIISDMWGKSLRGGTHAKRLSGDLALVKSTTGELLPPKTFSPSLDTRMEALAFLAQMPLRCGVFAEGDHFHVQWNVPPGVYTAPSFRALYEGDQAKSRVSKRVSVIVKPDGTATPLDPYDIKKWCQGGL